MNFLQMLAQGAAELPAKGANPHPKGSPEYWAWEEAATQGAAPPEPQQEIVATGARQLDDLAVQTPQFSDLAGAPAPIEINSPNLIDQRAAIFNAKERRKQAEAEAMGQVYKPKFQYEVGKDFKANPNLQFGTRGILRDIIGNAVDFLGSLVGRTPTYRDEKIRDKMYGWDQGPEARAAAINRVMEYDPQAGMEIMKSLTAMDAQRESTEATAEYRKSQSLPRILDGVSGLATALISSGNPAAGWPRTRPAIQAQLDAAFGKDVYKLSEEYDAQTVMGLTRLGYKGTTVQKEAATILTDETKKLLKTWEIAFADRKLRVTDATRRRGQDLAYRAATGNAEAARELRRFMEENRLIKTGETEDIAAGVKTNTYSTAGAIRKNLRQIVYDKQGRAYYQYADGRMEPKK